MKTSLRKSKAEVQERDIAADDTLKDEKPTVRQDGHVRKSAKDFESHFETDRVTCPADKPDADFDLISTRDSSEVSDKRLNRRSDQVLRALRRKSALSTQTTRTPTSHLPRPN